MNIPKTMTNQGTITELSNSLCRKYVEILSFSGDHEFAKAQVFENTVAGPKVLDLVRKYIDDIRYR